MYVLYTKSKHTCYTMTHLKEKIIITHKFTVEPFVKK